jgi:AraC-like DNA-binding protein
LTVEGLAAALGVSAHRLRRAIRGSFGISLRRYILLRRLALLRIALRSTGPPGESPRKVALVRGFWHLGRLVQDYRILFSQDLSELLQEDGTPGPHDVS